MAERLNSWKAIALYLGREVRTVQRWAKGRGLPVYHLPGGRRPRVFALTSEVDAWLRAAPPEALEPPERTPAVAVLPFLDLGGEAGDHCFGDGLAEDLINELVRISGLRVIARTSSFAVTRAGRDAREIGRRLGAGWLVEGSVRRAGRRLRVSAQLIDAHSGVHAWSERYDRELTDMFALQDEIARSIARALRITLTHERSPASPPDLAAYGLWVQGRALSQQYTPETLAQARACYEAAIERDPLYARPHFGLAELLFIGAMFGVADPPTVIPRARAAIVRAIELDPQFGEAHALLGVFRGLLDYDWSAAEAAFCRALELSPGSATVLVEHAWYNLVPRMRVAAAVEEAQEAVALDPLSPLTHGYLGLVFMVARQYACAREASRLAVELAPGLWWLHWFYATALMLTGDVEEGLREFWACYEQIRQPLTVGCMAGVCGLLGQRERARELLAELEAMARGMAVPPAAFAMAYLGLGDDRVFEWFRRAIAARDPVVILLPSMPLYDSLRGDPRFLELLAEMRLSPTPATRAG